MPYDLALPAPERAVRAVPAHRQQQGQAGWMRRGKKYGQIIISEHVALSRQYVTHTHTVLPTHTSTHTHTITQTQTHSSLDTNL